MEGRWKRMRRKYERWIETRGFAVITLVCVAVIIGTAVWTRKSTVGQAAPLPTPPVVEDSGISAAQLLQEHLRAAITPTPLPATPAPAQWRSPLDSVIVLRPFDGTQMVRSGTTGLYTLHDAVDLQASAGEKVYSMADGVVAACEETGLYGARVVAEYAGDVRVEYAGMQLLAALKEGDVIRAGQTLGFAGSGMVEESDLPVHLHLRVTRKGTAIDPMLLLHAELP